MTEAYSSNYWLSPNALYITLNALGNRDYIQANTTGGTQILVYVKGIIGYDEGHNYRRWSLQASPTVFGDSLAKYVYAAIPRNSNNQQAFICYPSEKIDIYGKNASETQIGSTDYYYIFLQGVISANNGSDRTWTTPINTGTLSTDEALNAGGEGEWYSYSFVSQMVTFLKTIASATINTLTIGTELIFGTRKVTSIATEADASATPSAEAIATPDYVKAFGNSHYLRKDVADTAAEKITFAKGADFGTFNKGVSGSHIGNDGTAEMGALTLRESLTVPKLVYNRTEVQAGNVWRTVGGGEIASVTTNNDGTGIITLKLEDGEIGMIATGDICQGVYHLSSGNDTTNSDGRNGNFTFAGFKTIYFEVLEILDTDDNSQFSYKLRSVTDTAWSDSTHPQPHMNFAVYGNRTNAQRQSSALDTTQYHLLLAGVTSWNYTSANIQYIEGYLTGFNIDCRYWDKTSQQWVTGTKTLSGYGLAFGKAYMWGNIEQFDRKPSLVSQQIKYLATTASSGVTPSTAGWTNEPQTATKEKPYLWQYFVQTFSDDTTKNTDPFIAANYAADGTSVEIYGSYLTETALRTAYAARELNVGRGHGYTVQDTGHLWVFITDTYSGTFNSDMQDVGQIKGDKGDDGKTYYTWVKYADDASGTNMSDYPDGKPYLGIAYNKNTSAESMNPNDYTWSKITGEDGQPGTNGTDGKTYYTWIKYADVASPTSAQMYDTPTDDTKYIGIAVNKTIATEGTNPADYTWSKFRGEQGIQGVPGTNGNDGKTYYTWVKYADDASGTNMSDYPAGKSYLGIAYNKETATESTTPSDYTWSKIVGEQGQAGTNGTDGQTYYTWIKYADVASPTSAQMYDTPTDSTKYIGIAVNKTTATEGTNPADYTWSQFKGDKGEQGIPGTNGRDGTDAFVCDLSDQLSAVAMTVDGKVQNATTLYTTFAMFLGTSKQTLTSLVASTSASGVTITKNVSTGLVTVAVAKDKTFTNDRISINITGTCAKGSLSTVFTIQGVRAGAEGEAAVLYSLAPADPFVKIDKQGAYSATSLFCFVNKQEGNDITTHVDYGTIKVVLDEIEDDFLFDDGDSILYDDDTVLGGVTMYDYDSTTGFIIGSTYKPTKCVKFILYSPTGVLLDVENVPVVIDGEKGDQGEQGIQGIPGNDGKDGKTYYTWVKYADDASGTNMSDYPDGKPYLGIAYNKNTSAESMNPNDYTWSKIVGEQGQAGTNGADGKTYYTWIKYADVASPTSAQMYDTPTANTQYIGIAVNKTTAAESKDPADYTWSKFKGDTGATGTSALYCRLSAPYGSVLLSPDGEVVAETTLTTTLSLYYGITKQSFSSIIVNNAPTGVTVRRNTGTGEITVVIAEGTTFNDDTFSLNVLCACTLGASNTTFIVQGVRVGREGGPGSDGKGISSAIEYYKLTSTEQTPQQPATNIDPTSVGWSMFPQITDTTNRFMWSFIRYTWTDGSVTQSFVKLATVRGEDGSSIEIKGSAIAYYDSYTQMTYTATTDGVYLCPLNQAGSRRCYYFTKSGSTWTQGVATVGDTYITNNGHLYVAQTTGWLDAGELKGQKGDPGTNGEDAKRIYLSISPDQVVINASGVRSASQITATAYEKTGSGNPAVVATYYIQATPKVSSGIVRPSGRTGSSLTVSTENYTGYTFELYSSNPNLWGSNAVLLDTRTITFVNDGATGARGYTGPMARPCGVWNESAAYVYDETFRDIVVYEGTYYAVKRENSSVIGVHPTGDETSSTDWEPASNFKFVATDLLLAQLAYIANLGVNNLIVRDSNGVYGGFCLPDGQSELGLGDIRLWLGSSSPASAPFRVDKKGSVVMTDCVFSGLAKPKETVITSSNYTQYIFDGPFGTEFDFSSLTGRVILDSSLNALVSSGVLDLYIMLQPTADYLDNTLSIINNTSSAFAMTGPIVTSRGGEPSSRAIASGQTFFGRCIINKYGNTVYYAYLIEYLNTSHS